MGKDDQTWLNICFAAFALLMAYVAYQAVFTIGLQSGWTERYDEWYQFPLFLNVSAFGLGGAALFTLTFPIRTHF